MTGLLSGDVVVRARMIYVEEMKITVQVSYACDKDAVQVSKF